jgi:flagellar basal body P-ring formation protein FlgA
MSSLIPLVLAAISSLALLLPLHVSLPGTGTAWGAVPPITEIRIFRNAEVRQKDVSLADICDRATMPQEWQAVLSGINIGDAPLAGSEKFIDPGQLRDYLVRVIESQGVNSSDVKLDIPDRIVVRRESTSISQEQIEAIFTKYITDNSPWKREDIVIQRVNFSGIPKIPTGHMTYEVIPGSKERFIGNITASIDFFVNGEKVRTLGVAGRVEVHQNVFLAARPFKQNEIITLADLELKKVNITDAADRYAMKPEQVENRRVLRNVSLHQPIELKDLDKPLVLKRGDPVTIVFDLPGLQVTAKGQVNVDAGVGDSLAVTNISSKKTVFCKVVDSQTLRAAQ